MQEVEIIRLKARSKAGKLRPKRGRGRPRIEGIAREPNGRRSRAKKPREAIDRLAILMRAKHTGLSEKQAKDPRASTYIGRLFLAGPECGGISEDQYNAALKFIEVDNNYKKALLSPAAYYDDFNSTPNPELYEAFCKRAKKQYLAAREAIQEAQFDNRIDNLYAALQYIVLEDLELPHLVGATRLVLNALNRHFFLANKGH
ncbi:hypothetical protein [uncultured Bartonella sp.]|uniref:hypothetical protein n=1 Tax=uncultured Bartonella sp. TaxID=104108 RepID=UPI0025EDBAC3|nr:hypothetical protein [uncultured Bartonella sp.]